MNLKDESIHLKCDEVKEKQKWIECLSVLKDVYAGKKIFDWEDDRKSHKEEIDVRVLHLIMDEHEGRSV